MDANWLSALTDLAFPVVVAFYLLYVLNHTMKDLSAVIKELVIEIRVGLRLIFKYLGEKAEEEFDSQVLLEKAKAAGDKNDG